MSPRITRSTSRVSIATSSGAQDPQASGSPKKPVKAKPPKKSTKRAKDDQTGEEASSSPTKASMAPPTTPLAKRLKKNPALTTPPTRIKGLHTSGDVDDALPPMAPNERPAEPHMTNAALITPGGSKLVAYAKDSADLSPSKSGVPRATTTTDQLLQEACNHLIKVDPRMKPLIENHYCRIFSPEGLAEALDPFRTLCTGIMGQQVSGAAAASIKKKFIGLFNDEPIEGQDVEWVFPTPSVVASSDISFLRQAGLSQRKAEYIKGLAEKFASGELSAKMLIDAPYEEMMEKLIAVRGLGQWSVEMFACFTLKRMDVFSTGDLGVQRGMAAFQGKDVSKLKNKGGKWKYMSEKDMLEMAAPFAPYR